MTEVEVFILCCAVFAGGVIAGSVIGSVYTEERMKKDAESTDL